MQSCAHLRPAQFSAAPPASAPLPKHDLLNYACSIAPALTTAASTPQEPEPETKKPKEEKEVKPAKKPDEDALKEKIGEQDEKIAALQARLQKIKDRLDNRESHSDNSKIGAAKAKFKAAQQESRRYQQEKRNIFDEISAADDMRKQQQDLTNRLKSELQFFSVEEIERRIKALEHQQQTTSLSVKEDKKMMEDIKRLRSNIPLVKQYDEAQESLRGIKEHHNDLYTRLKAKAAELSADVSTKMQESEEGTAEEAKKRADRLTQLTTLYSAMRPGDAAAIMDQMSDEMVLEILPTLPDRNAARILNGLGDDERKARLSAALLSGQTQAN